MNRAAGKSSGTAMSSCSVSSNRTPVLSSRQSTQPQRSCAPGSSAPSRTHAAFFQSLQIRFVGLVAAAPGGGGDEHFFQPAVTVVVESPGGHRFSAAHDFSGLHFIFRAHVGDYGQPHVTPELTLGAEPVRRVNGGDNECRPDRSQLRDRRSRLTARCVRLSVSIACLAFFRSGLS